MNFLNLPPGILFYAHFFWSPPLFSYFSGIKVYLFKNEWPKLAKETINYKV